MRYIKKFNESVTDNPLNYLKSEILDILQDSFLDNEIPVEVDLRQPAQVRYDTIERRQSIYLYIGKGANSAMRQNLSQNDYISLKDKWNDIKRLINWAKTENLILKDFKIYKVMASDGIHQPIITERQIDVDVDKWDGNSNLHFTGQSESKKYTEKYAHIIIRFENMGWQTSHKLAYGDPITNQIVQEYAFYNINEMTNFISQSMKIFESLNHHPHYFHWSGSKIFISLKKQSSNSVTQKDWDVASALDKI
jgi:pterin-4a-carbinolamine dehydratase